MFSLRFGRGGVGSRGISFVVVVSLDFVVFGMVYVLVGVNGWWYYFCEYFCDQKRRVNDICLMFYIGFLLLW